MAKLRIHIFIGSFVFIFFLLHAYFQWLGVRQARFFQHEIKILHSEVEDRFKLLLENNLSILMVSVSILEDSGNFDATYREMGEKILKNFEGILGLNYVDTNGMLTKVSLRERNERALGKRSQQYGALLKSLEKGEPFFISPPFDLYQGIRGIGFYMPFFNKGQFMGWLVIVQGLDRFMEKFVDSRFLGAYHLIILDAETQRRYYASAEPPADEEGLTKNKVTIKGREVSFVSWRKNKFLKNYVSWTTLVLISFILSLMAVVAYWALEQKAKAKRELENVEALLRATFTSASNNLNAIQDQFDLIKMGSGTVPVNRISNHLAYLSLLINQLKTLVKIAEFEHPEKIERTSILPMIIDLSKVMGSKLQAKDLLLNFENQDFIGVEIQTYDWIRCHEIFECLLEYFIQISASGDEIKLHVGLDLAEPTITMTNFNRLHSPEALAGSVVPECLREARELLKERRGSVVMVNRGQAGSISVSIPGVLTLKS